MSEEGAVNSVEGETVGSFKRSSFERSFEGKTIVETYSFNRKINDNVPEVIPREVETTRNKIKDCILHIVFALAVMALMTGVVAYLNSSSVDNYSKEIITCGNTQPLYTCNNGSYFCCINCVRMDECIAAKIDKVMDSLMALNIFFAIMLVFIFCLVIGEVIKITQLCKLN